MLKQSTISVHGPPADQVVVLYAQPNWTHNGTPNTSALLGAPYDVDIVIKDSPAGKIIRNASAKDIASWRNYITGTSPYFCKSTCCWRWMPTGFPYKGGRPRDVTSHDILSPAQNKLPMRLNQQHSQEIWGTAPARANARRDIVSGVRMNTQNKPAR